jgi:amidase
MPTIPLKATKLPSEDCTIEEYIWTALNMLSNTCPFDVSGHPALTINAGYSEGLPVGMMIIGRHFDEQTVLNAAFAFETVRDSK